MVKLERDFPFGRRLLVAGVYDIFDRLHGRAECDKQTGTITCRLNVFERTSTFAFAATQLEDGSHLCITIPQPAEGLSQKGQERALHFLFDSIDQHLENALGGKEVPAALKKL